VPSLKTFSRAKSGEGFLLDVSVLFALTDPGHIGHRVSHAWMKSIAGDAVFLCPITEAGLVRLICTPQLGGESMPTALAVLRRFRALNNCADLPISESWLDLIKPLEGRLHGHRQVTDALLLGLAIKNDAVLVTLDRGLEMLAGHEFKQHLLVLGDGA
jgi:uncharacterized protein